MYGDRAKLLAGGQSLVPLLNLRLSAPEIVIDVSRIEGLAGITRADGVVTIGALTTHAEVAASREIAEALPLLKLAAPHIAHVAIRNVGTFGGSLALADPSTEWPACCVALDATIVAQSKRGTRRIRAHEFFRGIYSTALEADEILTAVELPVQPAQCRSAFLELARRRGDYALIGVAAIARNAGGVLSDVRLAYLGAGETPVLAQRAMAAVEEKRIDNDAIAACAKALGDDLKPMDTLDTNAETKMHLARVLTGRALRTLSAS